MIPLLETFGLKSHHRTVRPNGQRQPNPYEIGKKFVFRRQISIVHASIACAKCLRKSLYRVESIRFDAHGLRTSYYDTSTVFPHQSDYLSVRPLAIRTRDGHPKQLDKTVQVGRRAENTLALLLLRGETCTQNSYTLQNAKSDREATQ